MMFTNDEKTLLLLYAEDTKDRTYTNLKLMRAELQPDEKELFLLTSGVIEKLEKMAEQEFQNLNLWDEMR